MKGVNTNNLDAFAPTGFPSPAQDYKEHTLDLNEKLITHPSATFLIKVSGDSMIGEGIFPDSVLLIDRSIEPVSGKIILAVLNGEFTIRKLFHQPTGALLMPANKRYSPVQIFPEMDFQVWGVVTWVLRNVNT